MPARDDRDGGKDGLDERWSLTARGWALVTLFLSQIFPLAALWLGLQATQVEGYWFEAVWIPRLVWVVVLYEFLPFTAASFFLFARKRHGVEVQRVMSALKLGDAQKAAYFEIRPGRHFVMAVGFASLVTAGGLTLLAFGSELEGLLPRADLAAATVAERSADRRGSAAEADTVGGGAATAGPAADTSRAPRERDTTAAAASDSRIEFPRPASGLIMGMGFLGAYIWGLLALTRRYHMADLNPAVYYGLSTRMVAAAFVSLVIFNAAGALTGIHHDAISGGITGMIWPAVAFTIGAFPQRGVHWLTERLTLFNEDESVDVIPLSMIEGITPYDRMRLEEEDIDSCYDLAHADLLPLVLRTPYTPRAIKDWILQAKLVELFSLGVRDLRQQGIRTLTDLRGLDPQGDEVVRLAKETSVTENALKRAVELVNRDPIVKRELALLDDVVYELGRYQRHLEPSPGEAGSSDAPAGPGGRGAPPPS